MNWQHKPEHYAAVHFHDDDIYDFEWDTDFKFKIPKDMPSGIYLMKIMEKGTKTQYPSLLLQILKRLKQKFVF